MNALTTLMKTSRMFTATSSVMMEYLEWCLLLFNLFIICPGALVIEPSFDVPVVNVTVKEGTTAILPCSVNFLGQYQVVWTDQWSMLLTFEDRRIIDDERLSIERPYTKDWNLHIRKVKYKDQGLYNCQVNTSPIKLKTVHLKVQVTAKIIPQLSSNDMTVLEGDTVTLTCNVSGIPMPTVTWYRHTSDKADDSAKESEFCPGTTKIGTSGEVLVIHNVSRYCDGIYECEAFNGVPPKATRLIRVSVEFPPEIRLPNKKIGQEMGKDTILECIVSANPQEITVWKRNDMEIHKSIKYRVEIYEEGDNTITLSLRVRNLDETDFGKYTCTASNILGSDEESMIVYDYSMHKLTTPTTIRTTDVIERQPIINKWMYPDIFVNGREENVHEHMLDWSTMGTNKKNLIYGASGTALGSRNSSGYRLLASRMLILTSCGFVFLRQLILKTL
ncbi:limbic system-associated membrane protein-like [Gigantopelta aegis]|uniref:limbic system-associated membrane protein-like n=1 Tax=Gigantopelta aegis TaxID=1735272 RepID=UPI001B889CDF|nr:limbic system-associated membrane protein-like [Gigantopelta aegis]